jgi:hypothetical protein
MAVHAFLEVWDSFANVLRTNAVSLVLVAPIASIFAGIVVDVASAAFRVVVAIEQEELCVVERGRFPALSAVTV